MSSDAASTVLRLVIAVILILFALLLVGGGIWFAGVMRRELSARGADVDRRLSGLGETFDRRLSDLDQKVDTRLQGLDSRLQASARQTGETTTQIAEKLGKLDGTASQMLARANDLARLEQALRPPKARGGFGELLLENLLRDRLPPSAYSVQHTFSSGDRVDAVVRAGQLISIDSKFPLDNFERIVAAATDEERKLHEKAFARDVRGHIDAIATKYIRPQEGTFDFAFMYVPVENVYYELTCGGSSALLDYAHSKRVFFVSPTTFTAYLQVIVLGLRGMRIEEHAQEVMAYVAELGTDFDRFKEDFDLVGTHLGRAQTKFADADKRLDKFEVKLERAAGEGSTPVEAEAALFEIEAA
jgi:DNA recombination protein RmuC